jgi:hypothetical protein
VIDGVTTTAKPSASKRPSHHDTCGRRGISAPRPPRAPPPDADADAIPDPDDDAGAVDPDADGIPDHDRSGGLPDAAAARLSATDIPGSDVRLPDADAGIPVDDWYHDEYEFEVAADPPAGRSPRSSRSVCSPRSVRSGSSPPPA